MQKITPFLWFDTNAEEAMSFYVDVFSNRPGASAGSSKIVNIQRYPDNVDAEEMKGMQGKVLTGVFELNGYRFMALDGGPIFKKTPAISFFINCKSQEEVQTFWNAFGDGGTIRMPLEKYDFSEKYGWIEDKYGVNWQVMLKDNSNPITPSLMFVQDVSGRATEAMNLYKSIFPDSKVEITTPYPPEANEKEGAIMYGEFTLFGQKFVAMDSSTDHQFTFTEGISLYVECEDQEEVDKYWNALTSYGGQESQCGWLKDKYGVSWQIIPKQLGELMSKDTSGRVMQAMLGMKKIVVSDLEKAYNA